MISVIYFGKGKKDRVVYIVVAFAIQRKISGVNWLSTTPKRRTFDSNMSKKGFYQG